MAYNRVIFSGNISRMDDLKQTPGGHDVLNFSLAVDRDFKKEVTDFIPVTAWRNLGANVAKFKSVGDPVLVEGRLEITPYEKDGQKRTSVSVVADKVEFLRGGSDNSGGGGGEKVTATDTENVPF
jgi:single-strand DNA-binding protein